MPFYNEQTSEEYKDSIADFSRSTLQKEQDFHVGLRSEIREAYLKFGVESTVYVSSPRQNILKHENMTDCVVNNIADNTTNLESSIFTEQVNILETSTEPSQPNNIKIDDVAESDNTIVPDTVSLDNVQNNVTAVSVESVAKSSEESIKVDILENISKASVKDNKSIDDVVTEIPGNGKEEVVSVESVGTAIDAAQNEILLAISDIEEPNNSADDKEEHEIEIEAEPAENSVSPNPDPAAEDDVPSPVSSGTTSGYQSVGEPTPVNDSVETLVDDTITDDGEMTGNIQEVLINETDDKPEDAVEPPEAAVEEKSSSHSNLQQHQPIPVNENEIVETAPEDIPTEIIQSETGEENEKQDEIVETAPENIPTEILQSETGEQNEIQDEVVQVVGSSSTMGQSNSRVISEIFKNTAGIEEGLLEIVEKVSEVVIEENEETPVVVVVESTEVIESTEVVESSNLVEITPVQEPDQGTQDNNLVPVTIKITTPSRRDVVMDDASQSSTTDQDKQESVQEIVVDPASQEEIQEIVVDPASQEEITKRIEVTGGNEEEGREEIVETFVTQMEGTVQTEDSQKSYIINEEKSKEKIEEKSEEKSDDCSVEVLEEQSPESPAHATPLEVVEDKVQDFEQLQAQCKILTSKLEQQELSLLQAVANQQRIEEELSHYKQRNAGLEERYQFTVKQLDTQKEITSTARTEKNTALIKLRDTEKIMKELDQSITLLKHKQIQMERNKSKICVIL